MTLMIRIYVTGTNGSGKGEVGKYLKEKYNFSVFSARALLEEVGATQHVGLVARPDLASLANALRDTHGGDYMIRALTGKAEAAERAVFDSVRCTAEVDYIENLRENKNLQGNVATGNTLRVVFVSVDADPVLRHSRVMQRKSLTDAVSFDDFINQEKSESTAEHSHRLNIAKCMDRAHIRLQNNSSLEDFHNEIEKALFDFFV